MKLFQSKTGLYLDSGLSVCESPYTCSFSLFVLVRDSKKIWKNKLNSLKDHYNKNINK